MEEIKTMMEEREKYLYLLKEEKENALKRAKEGSLRISRNRNKTQYYKRIDPKDCNGIYIREDDMKTAYELAQKDYDQKVLKSIEKELKAIQKYKEAYPGKTIEQIYDSLHPARQKLIIPIRECDEKFIARWEKVEYIGKDFRYDTSEHYTAKGERVRSKSEVIIADALNRAGIPYRYEYPLYIKGLEYILGNSCGTTQFFQSLTVPGNDAGLKSSLLLGNNGLNDLTGIVLSLVPSTLILQGTAALNMT